jgi:hypothetical protein
MSRGIFEITCAIVIASSKAGSITRSLAFDTTCSLARL